MKSNMKIRFFDESDRFKYGLCHTVSRVFEVV